FRGIVPNPQRELLPGMYVNIRLTLGTLNHAFVVPQAGLQRDNDGAFVKGVGADGQVVQKAVEAENRSGSDRIVTSRLAEGDAMIVSGNQKARPGMAVNAKQR